MSGETKRRGSDRETESDTKSQPSFSPVAEPDAAERSRSISADEQTQVAVWKPETQKPS